MTKAIVVTEPGGPEVMKLADVTVAAPKAGEIRLKQTAIGVNFLDTYHRSGLYKLPLPLTPGSEAVGAVTALGDGVTGLKVGDRVAYAGAPVGAYASERNLPACRCVKLPETVADEAVAAAFLKGITAHMLLDRVFPVGRGTTILVHSAAGGLGQLLTRWASALGAVVIGTVGSQTKAEIARGAGAHHTIVGRDADFAAAVADITGGRGGDVA